MKIKANRYQPPVQEVDHQRRVLGTAMLMAG